MRILKNVISSILVMFMFLYGINVNVKANSDEIAKLNMNETYSNIDLTAVTNFNTQIMGANLVKLSWNAVKGADGYIIYRKIADGKFEYRYMVSNTTYTDTTAQTGEYNFYRVYPYKNVNGKRVLGPSNEYKYVKPAPLGVKNLKAQATGTTSIKLTWNAEKDADGYIIYRKIADGIFEYRYMVSNTTYTDTTAKTGEYNFYRVYPYKNVKGKRVLGPSNEYKYVKPAPLGVKNLKAQATGTTSIKLTWNAEKDADGYIIYRKIADGIFEYRYMVSNTTYTDTTAKTGEYNFYRVYPYKNVKGKRVLGPSNEYKYAKPMPLAVTNLKTIRQNSNIKITWNTVSNADGYIIYRQSPNDSKMVYRYMVNSTSFVDTQTSAPGYYYYRVYAYKNVNGKRVLGPSNNYSYVKIPKTIKKYIEGMYRVGIDVPEGEYIVFKNNANLGYYKVTLTGNNDDIITNDILEYNGYITLQKGQSISLNGLDMYPVNHAPDLDMSSEGMFKVGKDIPAGTYNVVVNPEKEYGYYAICNDSYNRWDSIESNDYFKGNRFVTVKDGQYLQIKDSKIERIN